MSVGIGHLAKDNKTRPARIDSMDADSVNSIIERISGVNPSKLVHEAKGGKSSQAPAPAPVTAPMSAAAQGFDPYVQKTSGTPPDLQQMQQRMQMLEQRLAMYEQGGSPTYDKERASNHGGESRIFSRDRDPKKDKEPDVADGKPDSQKKKQAAQPGGQDMAGEHINILGMPMNEWRDLCGITTPYVNLADGEVPEHVLAESRDELAEDYFTEDELAEAWFEFIADKGFEPEEFAQFAEDAEEMGDEAAILAIQDLEDEFQEAVNAYLEGAAEKQSVDDWLAKGGQITKGKTRKAKGYSSLNKYAVRGKGKLQRDKRGHKLPTRMGEDEDFTIEQAEALVQEAWEEWLETRGLSVEMFNHLVDEAIASEDADEMDALLAVEDLFDRHLEEGDPTTWEIKKRLRGAAGREITPAELGMKPKLRKAGAEQKKEKGAGVMVKRGLRTAGKMESAEVKLPPMHPKTKKGPGRAADAGAAPALQKKALPVRSGKPQPAMSDKEKMAKLGKMLGRSRMTLRKEAKELKLKSLVHGGGEKTIQFPGEKRGRVQSLAHGQVKPSRKGVPAISAKQLASMKKKHDEKQKAKGEDPRKWAKQWKLDHKMRPFPGHQVVENIRFECDADDDGNPNIPWAQIMKSYNLKTQESY